MLASLFVAAQFKRFFHSEFSLLFTFVSFCGIVVRVFGVIVHFILIAYGIIPSIL